MENENLFDVQFQLELDEENADKNENLNCKIGEVALYYLSVELLETLLSIGSEKFRK